MRLHCGACDKEFDIPDGERVRCPDCLRRTGLTRVDPDAAKKKGLFGLPPAMLALLAVGVVALLSVGLFIWARASEPGKPTKVAWEPPAPRSDAELDKVLATAGIDAQQAVRPLALSDDVRALAGEIKVDGAEAKLRAAAEVVAAALRKGSLRAEIEPFLSSRAPRSAAELARALRAGDAGVTSSFELALLTVALARAAGAPALVGEALASLVALDGGTPGRAPALEPAGTRGVFVAALAPASPVSAPFAVRAGGQLPAEVDVRSDELVTQIFYAHRALALVATDPEAAARDADLAAKIQQPSPTVASARAAVAELVDRPETAVSIWRSAVAQGGNDAPRLAALALALLSAGDPDTAAAEARDALLLDPGQASAHGALARALASVGQIDEALRHLELARRDTGAAARKLPLAEAAVAFAKGDPKQARAVLEAALDDADPAVAAEAALTLYELAKQNGDAGGATDLRQRVLGKSVLKKRLVVRFDEIDQAYAPPPDAAVPPQAPDSGTPDGGKKYNIPDGKGIPI